MATLDIILCVFLGYGLVKGVKNGFFVELASLVSMLVGIFIAIKFSYLMKDFLESHYTSWNPKVIQVSAFALTFLLVIVAVSMLAKVFTSIANFTALGLFNKILGGVFGLLKTLLTLSILLNLFQKINSTEVFLSKENQDKSVLFHPVREVSKAIYPAIEDWFTAFNSAGFELEDPKE
ncbi:MAG TPA: CvpA family protein [Flavobacterium sp.]|jgi:membrane protein required for colicin V production|nr:CvpA family protein [Flavobacterium sp.]HPJ10456.1 CvpA family protein [Flavobacterium sp.]